MRLLVPLLVILLGVATPVTSAPFPGLTAAQVEAEIVELTEPTVSHHLTQLRTAGLIESDRRGMNVVHTARRDALAALCAVLDPGCC